ncbi:hypothetical protein [Halosimplex halophilum]|uniref:hypothetical protein n=1 Tax=Halosimplex halophilum TaxID=2559572 RepID=UPI00107FBF99|nr:hypothetical protein [Halosimplex halophilum]
MGIEAEGGPEISLLGRDVQVRRVRPRVVLALLLGASLAGVWLSNLGASVPARAVTWATVVAVGALAGGLYWRVALFDPEAFDESTDRRAVERRWARVEAVAVWAFALSGAGYLVLDQRGGAAGFAAVALGVGCVSVPVLWFARRRATAERSRRRARALRSLALLAVAVALGALAWIETGTTAIAWAVRLGHLGAVSLWLGGAVWHNFVVLPTVRASPGLGPVLKAQARRFRRHLPAVVPVVLATGAYQTDRLLGLSVPALLGSRIGHLVAFKVAVLTVLTGLVVASVRRG